MDRPIRIIIIGKMNERWTEALSITSSAWDRAGKLNDLIWFPNPIYKHIPPPDTDDTISVVIPLLEQFCEMIPSPLLKGYTALAPDAATVNMVTNRQSFSTYLDAIGLGAFQPRTLLVSKDTQFPIVLKSSNSMAGVGVILCHSFAAYSSALAFSEWKKEGTIAQEYIDNNREYVTHAICANGEIRWHQTFLHEVLSANPVKRFDSELRTSAVGTPQAAFNMLARLFKALNYNGPVNADYKIHDEIPKLMEINARFGGSLMEPWSRPYLKDALATLVQCAIEKLDP